MSLGRVVDRVKAQAICRSRDRFRVRVSVWVMFSTRPRAYAMAR